MCSLPSLRTRWVLRNMPAGSHRQGDAVQRVGCHTARLRRQTNASMCRSIAVPPKKVQPSIFCESRVRPVATASAGPREGAPDWNRLAQFTWKERETNREIHEPREIGWTEANERIGQCHFM